MVERVCCLIKFATELIALITGCIKLIRLLIKRVAPKRKA